MRSPASLALALVAPLAFAAGCAPAPRPPASPDDSASTGIPRGWRDPAIGKETRSPAMVGTGIGLIAISATMLTIGTVIGTSSGQSCNTRADGSFTCTSAADNLNAIGVLAAGAGGLAVGIPLLVLGAQKVPIEVPRRSALLVGPTGASFRYEF